MTFNENLLEILGVVEKEDAISNLLCHAFIHLPEFRERLFRQIDTLPEPSLGSVRGRPRMAVSGVGTPDIVLVGESSRGMEAIVIENKLGAAEGTDQTTSYTDPKVVEGIRKRFSLSEDPTPHFVFLTVMPDERPGSDKFIHVTYQTLLEDYTPPEGSGVGILLDELREHVERALEARNVSANQTMNEAINPEARFDAGYLAFQSVIKAVELPSGFQVHGRYRGSARGRRYYGALIRPDRWAPEKMDISSLPVRDFDPRRHVNIHFEPQANALTGAVTLYLHYEIHPYKTKKWAETHLPEQAFGHYRQTRSTFYRHLRKELPSGWSFRKGSNMLAKISYPRTATVQEVSAGMTHAIASATPVIDRLLDKLVFEPS